VVDGDADDLTVDLGDVAMVVGFVSEFHVTSNLGAVQAARVSVS
jgi:hypothetical protein